jgi:hypothetical protein
LILLRRSAPLLDMPFEGAQGIPPAVEALIGPRGLAGAIRQATPRTLDLVGLAVMEVLHTIVEHLGERRGLSGSVALWTEPRLAIIAVSWAGPALPDWMLANWDRGEEPASLEAPLGSGWGWLLVREAVDGVSAMRSGSRNILYLERWL